MRDFRSCELIGETSFGKGIMQDTFSLSNGSTVVLTVAEYMTKVLYDLDKKHFVKPLFWCESDNLSCVVLDYIHGVSDIEGLKSILHEIKRSNPNDTFKRIKNKIFIKKEIQLKPLCIDIDGLL